MQTLRKLFNTLLGRKQQLQDIDDELAFHMEQRRSSLVDSGMEHDDASRAARRSFGNDAALRDQVYTAQTFAWLSDLFRDLRFAARSLRTRKGLSLTVVLSLGISIAAISALFGFVDTLFLRQVSLPHPENVIALQEKFHGETYGSSPARMRDWAAGVPSLEHVGGVYSDGPVLTGEGAPSRVNALRTFGDMMGVFGEPPETGRAFTADEAAANGQPVALVSHRFYQQHFASRGIAADQALGHLLHLNGVTFTVVGILAANRDFPPDIDVITPAPKSIQGIGRQAGFLGIYARIKSGTKQSEIQTQLNTVNQRLILQYPGTDTGRSVEVQSVREQFGENARRPVLLLFAAALLLLLLADVNVATLLLTRTLERRHEAAIRLSIGAGRGALIRLYLYESLLLALAGGIAGVSLGRALFSLLLHMLPVDTSLPAIPVFDWRIAGFGFGLAMLSGLLFGIAPAMQISGGGTARLMVTRQVSETRTHLRWRQSLVVVQVALSMLLLTGVGLTARSLYKVRSEPLGFEPAQTVSVSVAYPWDVPSSKLRRVTASALDALARQPEVISSGLIDRLPLGGDTQTNTIRLENRQLSPELESLAVAGRAFAGDYFSTMSIPVMAGRLPRPQSSGDSPEIVVNETFARRFFPNGDAIGHRILDHEDIGKTDNKVFRRIVGIVGDTRVETNQVAEPPETFLLIQNTYWVYLTYVAKLRTATPSALAGVRAAVQQADPEQIVTGPLPLASTVAKASGDEQNRLLLLALFAGCALVLSCVGLYGVLAGDVSRKTREIGLRLALGASRSEIRNSTLRIGFVLTLAGLAAGSIGSLLAGHLVAKLLFGVKPTDVISWSLTCLVLLLVSFVASYLPARRASAVEPTEALRML